MLYSNQLSGYHIAYFRTLLLSKKLAHCKTNHHGGDTEVLQFCGDPWRIESYLTLLAFKDSEPVYDERHKADQSLLSAIQDNF